MKKKSKRFEKHEARQKAIDQAFSILLSDKDMTLRDIFERLLQYACAPDKEDDFWQEVIYELECGGFRVIEEDGLSASAKIDAFEERLKNDPHGNWTV